MIEGARIAIVDDEIHIRALIDRTLEDLEGELEILIAANGADDVANVRFVEFHFAEVVSG